MLSRVICARSAVGALLLLTAACGRRSKEPLVYVSNEDGGDVAVVDPNTLSVVALIPVGKRPRAVKLSRDGKLLYVALSGSPRAGPGVDESKLPPGDRSADGIGVVDLSRRALVHTYPSGQDPESFDLSLDGKTLYVSNEETAEISVLDLASGVLLAKVPVGREPEGVTVRPDGKFVYVTSEGDAEVAAIDTATLTVTAEIPTGARPRRNFCGDRERSRVDRRNLGIAFRGHVDELSIRANGYALRLSADGHLREEHARRKVEHAYFSRLFVRDIESFSVERQIERLRILTARIGVHEGAPTEIDDTDAVGASVTGWQLGLVDSRAGPR